MTPLQRSGKAPALLSQLGARITPDTQWKTSGQPEGTSPSAWVGIWAAVCLCSGHTALAVPEMQICMDIAETPSQQSSLGRGSLTVLLPFSVASRSRRQLEITKSSRISLLLSTSC